MNYQTLEEYLTTLDTHLKENDLNEEKTIAYAIELLAHSIYMKEYTISAYIVSKQLRLRAADPLGKSIQICRIPVYKLIRHTYRVDIEGLCLADRDKTIRELIESRVGKGNHA